MRNPLPSRLALLLALVASVASATEREPMIRNVTLPDGPDEIARPVFVAGAIATVLRFEKDVDAARTGMVGWIGRFEPLLVGGRSVLLMPLHDLTPEERFPLVVTLMDGTQVPLTVQAAQEGRMDHQVNLLWDPVGAMYLRASLDDALWRERLYREKAERYEKEEHSPDHALAALLATESGKQTRFRTKQRYVFRDEDAKIVATVFSGKGKAAVVFRVKNDAERTWNIQEARLTSVEDLDRPSPRLRPCAVRMTPRAIAPGASGAVAIVADRSAFVSDNGLESLALQLIRDDGRVQALVMLEPSLVRE